MQHAFADDSERILEALPARPFIALGGGVAQSCVDLLEPLLGHNIRLAVVSDGRTFDALGDAVEKRLKKRYALRPLVFETFPEPSSHTVLSLLKNTEPCDALIAIGGGTINDLCKYTAHLAGKPYAVIPTAPSMNGYTSANASIITDSGKQSFPATLPIAVLCDVGVLAKAPARLKRAGLGDSMARPTAQADWLMAHLTQRTPYDPRPFDLIMPYEQALFNSIPALMRGDVAAMQWLMEVLLLSGFGMVLAGGSYPASQGEHMIAHAYEHLHAGRVRHSDPTQPLPGDWPLHGEQIALTTLTMARIQEKLMPRLMTRTREKIEAVTLNSEYLESLAHAAGLPTTPEELGWTREGYEEAILLAPKLRERYTFLNML